MRISLKPWYVLCVALSALLVGCACESEHSGPGGGARPGRIDQLPAETVFYLADMAGSVSVTVDSAGARLGSVVREAYGQPRASSGVPEPFGFAGRESDASGLSDFGARPYRPELGCFLAPDPLALLEAEKLVGQPSKLPAYTYSSSDPVNLVDPTGRSPQSVPDDMTRQFQELQRESAREDTESKPIRIDSAVERYREALRESGNLPTERGLRITLNLEERLEAERREEQQSRAEGRMTAAWAKEINEENAQRAWDQQKAFSGIPFSASKASEGGVKYVLGWVWANMTGFVHKFTGPPSPPPRADGTGTRS